MTFDSRIFGPTLLLVGPAHFLIGPSVLDNELSWTCCNHRHADLLLTNINTIFTYTFYYRMLDNHLLAVTVANNGEQMSVGISC